MLHALASCERECSECIKQLSRKLLQAQQRHTRRMCDYFACYFSSFLVFSLLLLFAFVLHKFHSCKWISILCKTNASWGNFVTAGGGSGSVALCGKWSFSIRPQKKRNFKVAQEGEKGSKAHALNKLMQKEAGGGCPALSRGTPSLDFADFANLNLFVALNGKNTSPARSVYLPLSLPLPLTPSLLTHLCFFFFSFPIPSCFFLSMFLSKWNQLKKRNC